MHDVDQVNVPGAELSLVDLDDGALLAMARHGHQEAYAALFARYSYAAHRLARHLGQKEDSDDVVSEAFAQVLDLLGRGKGPERAFRAYLFTTVRHECARRAKARKRVVPTDDLQQIDTPVAFADGKLDAFERSAIRAAYDSLPVRWQTVLWHLDVEGRKPHELGPLLDLSANSVSALVYRARAGLREAYLQQHVKQEQPGDSRTCVEYRAKLSAFVRRTAPARDQERIHAHLESCSGCMAIYLDLQDVNRDVGLISVPTAVAAATAGLSTTAIGAHALVLFKGLSTAIAPPVAAAVLASAAVVGVAGHTPGSHHDPAVIGAQASPAPAAQLPAAGPDRAAGTPEVSRSADRPPIDEVGSQRATAAAPRPAATSAPATAPTAAPVPRDIGTSKGSRATSPSAPAPRAARPASPATELPGRLSDAAASLAQVDVVGLLRLVAPESTPDGADGDGAGAPEPAATPAPATAAPDAPAADSAP